MIDGGQPQVRAAQDALMAAGVSDLPVIGLAKRLEEVWLPEARDPIILPRTSEALYLLQRVRDEAHRTAIGLHRKRRGSAQRPAPLMIFRVSDRSALKRYSAILGASARYVRRLPQN